MKKTKNILIIIFCFLIIISNIYLYTRLESVKKTMNDNNVSSTYALIENKIDELNNKLNDDISSLVSDNKELAKKISRQSKLINSNTNEISIINKWQDKLNSTFTANDISMQTRMKYIRLEEYRKELKGE